MTSRSPARPIATAYHRAVVAGQRVAEAGAGDRVPDPHRPVVGAGDDDVAVPGPPDRHRVSPGRRGRAAGRRGGSPVTASQTRTVASLEPETMTSRSPARPIATAFTRRRGRPAGRRRVRR